jgi:alkaline phosphatase
MKRKTFYFILSLAIGLFYFLPAFAQESADIKIYPGGEPYTVKTYPQNFKGKKPKNIILFIADGMGVSHAFAGLTANRGNLFLENLKYTGFVKTASADRYVTDSAAGGTALATGIKTYNGAIGVDVNKNPVKNILEEVAEKGIATGLVSTSSITHATPASFLAHQANRSQAEDIAADFLKFDIDVFIGGGYDYFAKREDGRNLVDELIQKGYSVEQELSKIESFRGKKLAGLTAPKDNGRMAERGNMLPVSTEAAINVLSQNKKGFFLMVEGSQIDWGGHAKNTVYVVEDMLDLDRAVGKALDFASKDGRTLVIVTSDHETGGMAIHDGSFETGMVKGEYTTGGHTGVMVPIFAYGPGAAEFIGIMENTDVHAKMRKLLIGK